MSKERRWRRVGVLAAVLSAALAAGACDGRVPLDAHVHESEAAGFEFDGEPSDELLDAALDAFAQGEPMPPGVTLTDWAGRVTGRLTGLRLATGELEFVVTVEDDVSDLREARLFVGEDEAVAAAVATLANGGVTPTGERAIATLTGSTSPLLPVTVRVEWDGAVDEPSSSYELTLD